MKLNKISLAIYIIVIASIQIICQPENSSYISEEKMRVLDSLKMYIYNKYNHNASEIRNEYREQIILDTTIVTNDKDRAYDSLIVIQTDEVWWGFGKSKKRKIWDLIGLHSDSEKFFKEFGVSKSTTLKNILTQFDSTNSYEVFDSFDEGNVKKFVISFNDTDEFIFFTEFTFYIESDSLKAVGVDFIENR